MPSMLITAKRCEPWAGGPGEPDDSKVALFPE